MNEPAAATIFEESSAESCIDPNNPNLSSGGRHPSGTAAPSPKTGSTSLEPVSHVRAHSDTVQYTRVEVGAASAASPAWPAGEVASAGGATRYTPTQYASLANQVRSKPNQKLNLNTGTYRYNTCVYNFRVYYVFLKIKSRLTKIHSRLFP